MDFYKMGDNREEERERKMKKILLALLVVFAACNVVSAITVDGSTNQRWDFLTDANPAVPETVYNPYGDVEAALAYPGTAGDDPVWNDGVWSGVSIKFTATIPNTSNTAPDSYKDIVIEVGYKGEVKLANITVGQDIFSRTSRETDTYDRDGEIWTIVRDYYRIEPNPTSEIICYGFADFSGGNQQIDYVDIYTVCVPEPMTICLLGLSTLIIRRRKTL